MAQPSKLAAFALITLENPYMSLVNFDTSVLLARLEQEVAALLIDVRTMLGVPKSLLAIITQWNVAIQRLIPMHRGGQPIIPSGVIALILRFCALRRECQICEDFEYARCIQEQHGLIPEGHFIVMKMQIPPVCAIVVEWAKNVMVTAHDVDGLRAARKNSKAGQKKLMELLHF